MNMNLDFQEIKLHSIYSIYQDCFNFSTTHKNCSYICYIRLEAVTSITILESKVFGMEKLCPQVLVHSAQSLVLEDPTYQILARCCSWKPMKSLWWLKPVLGFSFRLKLNRKTELNMSRFESVRGVKFEKCSLKVFLKFSSADKNSHKSVNSKKIVKFFFSLGLRLPHYTIQLAIFMPGGRIGLPLVDCTHIT